MEPTPTNPAGRAEADGADARDRVTLAAAIDAHVRAMQHRRASPRSIATLVEETRRHLGDWFERPLAGLRRHEVAERHEVLTRERGPYVANRVLAQLRAVWNTAARRHEHLSATPPTIAVTFNRVERRREPIPWSGLARWGARVAALRNPVRRDLLFFLLFTGLRSLDARTVRFEHVTFEPQRPPPRLFDRGAAPAVEARLAQAVETTVEQTTARKAARAAEQAAERATERVTEPSAERLLPQPIERLLGWPLEPRAAPVELPGADPSSSVLAVLHRPSPKGGPRRAFRVPLARVVQCLIERRRRENAELFAEQGGDQGYVFPTLDRCGRVTHVQEPKHQRTERRVDPATGVVTLHKVTDLPSPHRLRDTFATAAHEVGVNPLDLKVLMNHALPHADDVTQGYIRPSLAHLHASAEAIAAFLLRHLGASNG